jgi:hypothetical protein
MILYLDGVYLLGLKLIFESTELVGYYSKYIGNGREAIKMKFCIVGTHGSAFLLYKLHKNLILQQIMLFLKLVISNEPPYRRIAWFVMNLSVTYWWEGMHDVCNLSIYRIHIQYILIALWVDIHF